jgi:hypothetical protein
MSQQVNHASQLSPSLNNDGVTQNPSVVYNGTVALASGMTTAPIFTKRSDAYSVQISLPVGSTLVGSFALQCSNDLTPDDQSVQSSAQTANWTTLSFWDVGTGSYLSTKAIVSGANSIVLAERGCVYRWMRLVFTYVSGTGDPTITYQDKGWS